jgi:hypothetical protein
MMALSFKEEPPENAISPVHPAVWQRFRILYPLLRSFGNPPLRAAVKTLRGGPVYASPRRWWARR